MSLYSSPFFLSPNARTADLYNRTDKEMSRSIVKRISI